MGKHSASSKHINHFQQCWDLGYRMMLPVVPTGVGLAHAGKRPGVLSGGVWIGKGYQEFVASADVIGEWDEWGASVGVSCSETGLCGIDIDTLSPRWAAHTVALARKMLGDAPRRIGRAPKVLLPYRCPADMSFAFVKFHGEPETSEEKTRPGLIECLAGEGKWFVAHGIHPQTLEPYAWPDGERSFSELTLITIEQRDRFFAQLRSELPGADLRVIQGGKGRVRPPEELRGDLDTVTAAMREIPNDPAVVSYHDWRDMAAALQGAVGFDDGLELFEAWSEKAEFTGSEPRYYEPRKLFRSLDPGNISLGADYIFHHAEMVGWTGWARQWDHLMGMDVPPEEIPYESIFGVGEGSSESGDGPISASQWEYIDPALIPPRDFLYGTHIIRRFASMTVAPSKVGKSSLMTVDALAMVTGRTLLPHMKPKRALRVWYINGEDPKDELDRRVAAAMQYYGLTAVDVGDRLHVNSGRSFRMVTAVMDRSGVKVIRPVIDAVIEELREKAIDVMLVDPFVSTHRVGESDNTALDTVMTEWIMTAEIADCGIEFAHHARKSGVGEDQDASINASRGGTAVGAKMRSQRNLVGMTKAEGKQLGLTTTWRDFFRVSDGASNLAPWVDDDTAWYRRVNVALANGDNVAVVVPWSTGDLDAGKPDAAAAMRALGADLWREDAQAKSSWAGNVIASALGMDVDDPDDKAAVKRLIKAWVKENILERVMKKDPKNSAMRSYVKVKEVQKEVKKAVIDVFE